MSKLTVEDKKEIIRLHKQEGYVPSELSKLYGIHVEVIRRLIHRYDVHGDKLFDKKYTIVTNEIKLEIIQRLNEGCSIRQLMVEYLVTDIQIHKWVSLYDKLGYDGLKNKKKGRPPSMKKENKKTDPNDKDEIIRQLKQRNMELECEVEALKKLRALVQQRNMQQTKKKQ